MSQQGGEGGDARELEGLEAFLWKGKPWELFDSDDSGGSHGETAMKPPETSSSIPSAPASNSRPGKGPVKRALGEGSKSSSSKGGGQEGKGGGESEHEMYLRRERERRKKMRAMFTNLHALLPHLPEKADKTSIVDEAISFIKKQELYVQQLEKLKKERIPGTTSGESSALGMRMKGIETTTKEAFKADQVKSLAVANSPSAVAIPQYPSCFRTWMSPNVVLNVTGVDAHISIYTVKKPRLFTAIAHVLEKYNIEVITAEISSNDSTSMIMIHAR